MTRSRYVITISTLARVLKMIITSKVVTKVEYHAVILTWLIFSSTSYKPMMVEEPISTRRRESANKTPISPTEKAALIKQSREGVAAE